MSDIKNTKAYGFPNASLEGDGQRFTGALNSDKHGPQVLQLLPATFLEDYTANLEQLSKIAGDHSHARGSVNVSTQTKAKALAVYIVLAGVAREAARAAFTGNDALLHSEFLVGESEPHDLASILRRGNQLIAACTVHAEVLAPEGWAPAQTTDLTTALEAVKVAKLNVHYASDAKEGLTAAQIALGNGFYRQCRAIQRVACAVYTAQKAKTDPSVFEARGLFLLGEFPKRNRASRTSSTPPAPPAVPVPPATGS
jgi:hypothetical protein